MLLGGITLLSIGAALAVFGAAGGFETVSMIWILPVGFLAFFLAFFLMAFLFLWTACAFVDMKKPQEEDSRFFRGLLRLYVPAIFTILQTKIDLQGMEQMPENGRFMLVCNHLDIMDPPALLHCFRNYQLSFISKRENDSMFLVGKIMHKILCQPINRENDREALKTILKCIQQIKENKTSIGVFPEGYTSRDGLLHSFRNGVFKIAQKAQVPIVVCTLRNTQHIFHNAARLKPTHVDLHLLEVIPPEELKGVTAVEIGERVHKIMADDLGPALVAEE